MNSPAHSARSSTPFVPVGIDWKAEPVEARVRYGLLALDTDHASETELHRMLPREHADLFATRMRHGGQCDVASLRAMGDELAAATALLLPGTPLAAIAYGCTSGTVAIGFDRVAEVIRSVRPGIAVTTPVTAAEAAFRQLDAKRIAVLTPYVDEVNELVTDYLVAHGVDVTTVNYFGLETDIQMSTLLPETIERAVLAMDRRGADAVFICCTALRSVQTIARLEARLGVPVVTSNQAMLWEMLRASGYDAPIRGFGQLLDPPACGLAGKPPERVDPAV